MELRLNNSTHHYYLAVMLALLTLMGSGIYFYWHKGPANIENITNVFEANLTIDEIKKRDQVSSIETIANSDRVREAVRSMDRVEADIKNLHRIAEVPSYEPLMVSFKEAREELTKLLSYPEQSNVVSVLSNKMTSFENYVSTNNWRTLTRVSGRVLSRISPEQRSSNNFFSPNKLADLHKGIQADVLLMTNVTTGSVLSQENKNSILNLLQGLETELEMMKKYASQLQVFSQKMTVFKSGYQKWFTDIEPAISYKKIEFERTSQNFLFAFLGAILFIFAMIGLGFVVHARTKAKNQKMVEKFLVDTLKEGVLPIHGKMLEGVSKEYQDEIEKYREYIHKRMSFGSIFQDAMPFSSALLDSNLNVVWANALFYEHWKFDKNNEESLTWDYLQRFTNLGEDDPVLQAVKENLAGIYSIQVKKGEAQVMPFEMYVSPVEYAGQKRILIIFYPLTSFEQTLADQTKSIVGPIVRTLDALSNGQYNTSFKQKIEKDFKIGSISHVHEKFIKYNQFVNQQKNGLLTEIERLETTIEDYESQVTQLNQFLDASEEKHKDLARQFNDVKADIVNVVENRGQLEAVYQSTSQSSKALLKEEKDLLMISKNASDLLTENTKAFETVSNVRMDFKKLKTQIDDARSRLLQLIDQSLVFQKTEGVNTRVEQSLTTIKNEMRSFDQLLNHFHKVSTQLDVGLSKVSMILDHNSAPDLGELEKKFHHMRENIENDMYDAGLLMRDGEQKDDHMIKSLKMLFSSFQEEKEILKKMEEVLKTKKDQGPIPTSSVKREDGEEADQASA